MPVSKESTPVRMHKENRYRYLIFSMAAVGNFLVFLHRNSTAVMAPALSADFGIGPAQIGLFGSMYFYAYAICQLPSGLLADRWGARKTTSTFLLLAGIGSLLFGFSDSFYMALGARFLIGLGVAFIYVSAMTLIGKWFKPNEYSTYIGLLVSIGNLGSLAASAPLVGLMVAIGWRNAMASIGLLSFFVAALLYIFVRNNPEEIGEADPSKSIKTEIELIPPMKLSQVLMILLKQKEFWGLILLVFGWVGTVLALYGLWLGPYLMNVYRLSQQETGNFIMFIAIGAIIGCPLIGYIADRVRIPNKKLVMAGVLTVIIILIPLIFFVDDMSLTSLAVVLFLFGVCGYTIILQWSYLREHVDPNMYGTAAGIINFTGFLGGALFQQILGIIIGRAPVVDSYIAASGFRSAFLFCLVYLVIALTIFSMLKSEPGEVKVSAFCRE